MKTIPVCLIVASVLWPVVACGQAARRPERPPPTAAGGPPPPPRAFWETWKSADTNHDGFLAKEEFDLLPRIENLPPEKRQFLFQRLDKDGDGRISREELARMVESIDRQGPPPLQRLWELDVDQSGGVSFEEFKAGQLVRKLPLDRQQDLFRTLDSDRDGMITPKDKPEPPFKHEGGGNLHPPRPDGGKPAGPHPDPRQGLRLLDRDRDGAVSLEEFRAGPAVKDLPAAQQQERFAVMDRNHDQQLTPEDFPPPPARDEPKHLEGALPPPEPPVE